MNTKVIYLYRDAANYKIHCEEVVRGTISAEDCVDLFNNYVTDTFYPETVGFPAPTFETQGWRPYDDDPDSHELSYFVETEEEPTVSITIEELVEAIKSGKTSERADKTDPDPVCLVQPVRGGKLVAKLCGDTDYPGIYIEFIPEVESDRHITNPCVVVEKPNDTGVLRALIWDDPDREDWTKRIMFPEVK